jgi:hypothetical protein
MSAGTGAVILGGMGGGPGGADALGLDNTKSTCDKLPAPSKCVIAIPSRCTVIVVLLGPGKKNCPDTVNA